jgi:hypothetical protein
MTNSFNSSFFIVAATVIPVLYLALTLQGSMLDGFIKQLKQTLDCHSYHTSAQ